MPELSQKISNLQNLKQERENQLSKQSIISQEEAIKLKQDREEAKTQLERFKIEQSENKKKLSELIILQEQFFLEKDLILNKIMKDKFTNENWDEFIKGMKITGTALTGGLKGALCSTAGLAGSGLIVAGCVLAIAAACDGNSGGSSSGGGFICIGDSSSNDDCCGHMPPSAYIGIFGGVMVGIAVGVGLACPATLPIAIPIAAACGGTTVTTGTIVEAIRSVSKKKKKQSSQPVIIVKLTSELILEKIKYLQNLNDTKSKDKRKEKIAKNLIAIKEDVLKITAEHEIQTQQLLSKQEDLIRNINLMSIEISKLERQIAKIYEPVQELEKEIIEIENTIHNLQNAENKVNELLSEVQLINSTAFQTFDNTFTPVAQNQKSLGL